LKWIVRLEKPPALSPEDRGKGKRPTIQRQHTRKRIPSSGLIGFPAVLLAFFGKGFL
jgi:hypothetical protein